MRTKRIFLALPINSIDEIAIVSRNGDRRNISRTNVPNGSRVSEILRQPDVR